MIWPRRPYRLRQRDAPVVTRPPGRDHPAAFQRRFIAARLISYFSGVFVQYQ
jgi:hypothetical protein